MIICIEGTDAAGKATQSTRLAKHLNGTRFAFPTYDVYLEAPAGRLVGAHLRGAWRVDARFWGKEDVGLTERDADAMVFQTLQSINRYEMAGAIVVAEGPGRPVVLDRYWPSGFVYGKADGLDPEWLLRIHACLPQPDLYILLDVSYETALARRPDRRDRYEKRGKDFYDKIRDGYRTLWDGAPVPGTWAIVDGNRDVEAVWADTLNAVNCTLDVEG